MDRNKIISFLLAFVMILGIFVDPVFAISSNRNEAKEVNYEIQEIDGKAYKVYKVSDIGLKNPEKLITPKYRTRAAGDPMEDWVKINIQSRTVGLTLGNDFHVEVYVALRKDDTKIAKAIINPTYEDVENVIFHFVKTAEYDENNPDHQDPDKWYLYVEDNFQYDIRLGYGESGNFGSESMTMTIQQRAMPLYKAVWFTNNQQRPVVDAIYNDGDNIANNVKLNTTDFAENEYKSFSSEKMPLYVAQKEVIVKEENLGSVDKENFLVSDMKGAVLWKLLIDQNGEKKTQGFVKDGDTKYHFNITGDYKTPFVATMREELKVKFDPNKATFAPAVKTEQPIGHSMKIGESFGDLEAVTVPTKDQITNIPKKDNKDQEFVGWVDDEANKSLDFSNGQNADKLVDPNGYEVKKNVTFYAVYAPVAQGKVAIQYVDAEGNAINDKYKIKDEKYPDHAEGNKGKAVEASKITEPKFIGYKRTTDPIDVTGKTYKTEQIETVEVKYEKLPDIIPEDQASEDVKNTYTKVTFAADTNKGKLKLGDTDGGAQKVYYVNPVEGKTIAQVKALDNITAEGKKDVYKVDETTPWTFVPDEVNSLTTVITTVPVTVNANFVKEKGTVTYEFISGTDGKTLPTEGMPTKPEDKKYDVQTEVTAEPASYDPVPVKETREGKEVVVGNWNFKGWKVGDTETNKLSVSKNGPNKFTGVWEFKKAGEEKVTYKFVSGTEGKTLPTEGMPTLPTEVQKIVGETVAKPADPETKTIEVKETINGTEVVTGKWTFDSWTPESLVVKEVKDQTKDKNEFVGKWNFTEADKGHLVYKFTSTDGELPKAVKDLMPKDNKENYVGVVVKPDALTQTSVDGKKDNKEGTWETTWAPKDVTLGKGENEVTIEWKFVPAKEGNVTYNFNIKAGAVPNDYNLDNAPFNKLKNSLEPKTAYVGRKVTAPTINQTFKENITFKEGDKNVEKQGNWTFEGWDAPFKDMVEEGITFTGTWTWKQEQSKKPEVNEPKKGDKVITGKGEPESVIEVEIPNPKDPTNPKKVTTTVGDDGKWTVDIPEAKEGDEYNVTQTEKGKTPSEKVTVKVKDKVKPEPKPEPTPVPEVEIPGIKYKDHYTPTYPVYVSVPDKKEPVQDIFTHEQYIFGYPDDTIRPDGDMTRAEAIAVVARLQKLDLSDKNSNIYKDTKAGMWYNAAINAAFREGYLLEKEGENIRPNDKITRAELALLISHIDKKNDTVAPFEDVKGHKFEAAINQAYGNERIKGYPDGTFKPDNSITRAEVATMLNKLYDRYPDKNYIDANQNLVHNYKDMSYKGHWGYYELVEAYHTHKFARLANNMEEWKAIIK